MSEPSAASEAGGFRPDVEGLRGVAVLVVVLFHSGLVGMPGGFVGVDVFFVISGFLITGLLLREHARSGTISLSAFYARRVRRLLPAAVVALLVTLVAAVILVAPLDRRSVATDAAAAALSVGNIRFALAAGDYFATVSTPAPFLHYWSLGVEEQFYLVWPALLLLAARGRRPVRRVGLALAVLCVAAFAVNVILTDVAPNWAFYSLPTRAWQLGIGGLLAVAGSRIATRFPHAVAGAAWLGLGAVVAAAVAFDSSLPYPGMAAAVPTLGAAALLAAGMSRFSPGFLLATPPLRFLGRISYSLYLWHWPVFVLAPLAIGGAPDAITSVVLVGLAVGLGTASYRWVETPFRRGFPLLGPRPARTVSFGLASLFAVAILSTGISITTGTIDTAGVSSDGSVAGVMDPETAWEEATPEPPAGDLQAPTNPPASPEPSTLPATADLDTAAGPSPSSTPSPSPSARPTGPIPLPRGVTPSVGRARGDEERLRGDGCLAFERDTSPRNCVYGVAASKIIVALVGDSHAAHWFPAVEGAAKREGWRLVVFTKVSCPFLDMRVTNLALKREYRECATWNRNVVARLRDLRPDLTLISVSRVSTHPVSSADADVVARGNALARMVERVGGRVGLIVDTPYAGIDVPACLSGHLDDIRRCAIPRKTAMSGELGKAERVAAAASGAELIDLTASICPGSGSCPVVVANHIVYRDPGHLTATFARSLAPALDAHLLPILSPAPVP